jgi:hypothetical protein
MRQSLMRTFEQIYVLDLHGNNKKNERSPDGSKDENVFDIEQGVAISLFIKRPGLEPLDDKIAREVPNLVPRAIEMLVSENVRRREQIALDLALPATDLEELAGLPFGFFRFQPAPVVPMLKAHVVAQQYSNVDGVIDEDDTNVVPLFNNSK